MENSRESLDEGEGFAQKVVNQAREAKTEPGAVATGFALTGKSLALHH
jgi:hypothetical protein